MFGRIAQVTERYLGTVLKSDAQPSGYIGVIAEDSDAASSNTFVVTFTEDATGDSCIIVGGNTGPYVPYSAVDSKGNTYHLGTRTHHVAHSPDSHYTAGLDGTVWIMHGEYTAGAPEAGDTLTITLAGGGGSASEKAAVVLDCYGIGDADSDDTGSDGQDFGVPPLKPTFNPATAPTPDPSIANDNSIYVAAVFGKRHKQYVDCDPPYPILDAYADPTIDEGTVVSGPIVSSEHSLTVAVDMEDAGTDPSRSMSIGNAGACPGYIGWAEGLVQAYHVVGGQSLVYLEDVSDFEETGTLVIDPDGDADEYAYTVVDEDTGAVSLTPDLVTAYPEGTEVRINPAAVERWATLVMGDETSEEEGMMARVPHALYDRIPVGIRDWEDTGGEAVSAEFSSDELVVTDVIGQRPVVDGSFIDPGTSPLSDGDPPTTSPDANVLGVVEALSVTWTEVDNADTTYYDIYVDTSADPSANPANLVASVPGNAAVLAQDASGSALVAGTTYYVAIIARDADGAAPAAGADGSGTPTAASGGSSTDGNPPSSSPAATVRGGVGFLVVSWDAVSNADPVGYEVHIDTSSGFTPSGGTLYTKVVATSAIIKTLADHSTALSYGTTYYVRLIAFDNDGSAAVGVQGSATMVKATGGSSGDIDANTITAANIAADTITAAEIAANAITATELAANAVTTAKLDALAVTTAKIDAGAVTATKISVSNLAAINADLGTITAGTIDAALVTVSNINASNIASGTLSASRIAAGSITASKLTIPTGGNLVANGGFEVDSGSGTEWTLATGHTVVSTGTPRSGTYHLKTTATGSSDSGKMEASAGDQVFAQVWSKRVGGSSATMDILVRWYDASDTLISADSGGGFSAGTSYGSGFVLSGLAPANTAYARVRLTTATLVGGANLYFDDVTCFKVLDASAYIAAGTVLGGTGGAIGSLTIDSVNIKGGAITAAKISVTTLDAITADMGTLTAGAITLTGSTSTNFIATATSGQRVRMDADGLHLYDSNDGLVVNLPTDSAQPAAFTGVVQLAGITATNAGSPAAVQGVGLQLASGPTTPITPPGLALAVGGSLTATTTYYVSYAWASANDLRLKNQADFETDAATGLTKPVGTETYSQDATNAVSGDALSTFGSPAALKVVTAATTNSGVRIGSASGASTNDAFVIAGQVYTFSIYAARDTTSAQVKFEIVWKNSSGTDIQTDASAAQTLTTTMTRYSLPNITAPAGAEFAAVQVRIQAATASTFYLDQAQLEVGASATTWVLPQETPTYAPPRSITTTSGSKTINVTVPMAPTGATRARIYIGTSTFSPGGASGKLQYVATVSSSATTTAAVSAAFDSTSRLSQSSSSWGSWSTGSATGQVAAYLRPASAVDSNGAAYGWTLEGNGRIRFLGPTLNTQVWLYDDFYGADGFYNVADGVAIAPYWIMEKGGTAAAASSNGASAYDPGVVQLSPGSTTSGYCGLRTSSPSFALGVGRLRFSAYVNPLTIGVVGNGVQYLIGLSNTAAGSTFANTDAGVVFRVNSTTAPTQWQLVTSNADGVAVATATGDQGFSANTWYFLEFEVDAGRTAVNWWINGVAQTAITTKIPTSSQTGNFKVAVIKTAGTTAKTLQVDAVAAYIDFVTG